jgi:hypothetical protein
VASTKGTGRKGRARKSGCVLRLKKKYVPSEAQRADDEQLLDQLRKFDLKKFDQALARALKPNQGRN